MKRMLVVIMLLVAVSLFADNSKKIKELRELKDKAVAEVEYKKLIPTLSGLEKGLAKLGLSDVLKAQGKVSEAITELDSIAEDNTQPGIVKGQALLNIGSIYSHDKTLKDDVKAIKFFTDATKTVGAVPSHVAASHRAIGIIYFKNKDYSKAIKAFNDGLAIDKAPDAQKGDIQFRIALTVTKLGQDPQPEWKKVLNYAKTPQNIVDIVLVNIKDVADTGSGLAIQLKDKKDKVIRDKLIAKTATSKEASRVVISTIPGDVEVVSALLPSADTASMELQARWDMLAKVRAALAGQIATNEKARALAGLVATEMEEVGNILKGQK